MRPEIERKISIVSVLEEISKPSEEEVTFTNVWNKLDCIDGVFEDDLDPLELLPDLRRLIIDLYGQYCVMKAKYNFMVDVFYKDIPENDEDDEEYEDEDDEDDEIPEDMSDDELDDALEEYDAREDLKKELRDLLVAMDLAGIKKVKIVGKADSHKRSKR